MVTSSKRRSRCQVHEGDRGADVVPSHPRGNDLGMIGHAPCKEFELCRGVYGEILRGLPTDINIPPRGQPK